MPEAAAQYDLEAPTIRGVGGEPKGWSEASRNREDRRLMDRCIDVLDAQRSGFLQAAEAADALAREIGDFATDLETYAKHFGVLRGPASRLKQLHGAMRTQAIELRTLSEPSRAVASVLDHAARAVHERRVTQRDNPNAAGRRALVGVLTSDQSYRERQDAMFLFALGAAEGLEASEREALARLILAGGNP